MGSEKRTLDKGPVIWLTGLSGSGKTTIALALRELLLSMHYRVEVLDGDELRKTISSELGFSIADRQTHARRVVFLSELLSRNGIITIVALISPLKSFRDYARNLLRDSFAEIWVKCSVETCAKRDVKGLYERAYQGKVGNMTGVQAAYENPTDPEMVLDTEKYTPEECVNTVIHYLQKQHPALSMTMEDVSRLQVSQSSGSQVRTRSGSAPDQ